MRAGAGDGACGLGRKQGVRRIMPAREDSPDIAAGGNHDPALGDLGLDSQGFVRCTCVRGKHRPVRNGCGACGSREENRCVQVVRMRTGERGRFPYRCWRPGVGRPEAVVPKIHGVHKREIGLQRWTRGPGVGRGAGEVGVRGRVRRGGSAEAGKGEMSARETKRRSG
jgi:hypothetical protein